MSEDQDSHLNLPELITKQQDLIQRLRRQLATAERDAANEAWVRKQLMQSFSWRITSPVRLAAQIVRSLSSKLKPAGGVPQQSSVSPANEEVSPSLNRNILAASAEKLGLPFDRVAVNIERYGNTLAGSIPLALDEALAAGRANPGDIVALVGFGAGLAWGGLLVQL